MNIIETLRQTGETLLSLLYPPHCVMCNANLTAGSYLCEPCGNKSRKIQAPFCEICSQPFDGAIEGGFSCANCAQRHFYFDHAVSRYRSRSVVRELLHRFKYQGEFYLRHPLAAWMIEGLEDRRIAERAFDFIVPVPLHPTRERERQFNQARVLAKILARHTGVPLLDCLKRIRKTMTQTQFDRAERMENLRNAFKMRNNMDVQGKQLILIDDVFTTGSTVNECARVLKKAGAGSIRVLTVARG